MGLVRAFGFAGALILAAIVGGTVIGSALAHDEVTGATDGATPYCDTFMDTLASELGVTPDAVVAAGKTAAQAAIDAAVEAGDLSEERAAGLKDRVADYDGTGCGWFGPRLARGLGHGAARGFLGGDVLEAAADALGLESSDVIAQLRDAESLQALADEHGVAYDDVKAAVLASIQADLDAAVADGMDRNRADAAIERLTTWLDDGGQLRAIGPGRQHGGFGPGPFGAPNDEESGA